MSHATVTLDKIKIKPRNKREMIPGEEGLMAAKPRVRKSVIHQG